MIRSRCAKVTKLLGCVFVAALVNSEFSTAASREPADAMAIVPKLFKPYRLYSDQQLASTLLSRKVRALECNDGKAQMIRQSILGNKIESKFVYAAVPGSSMEKITVFMNERPVCDMRVMSDGRTLPIWQAEGADCQVNLHELELFNLCCARPQCIQILNEKGQNAHDWIRVKLGQ